MSFLLIIFWNVIIFAFTVVLVKYVLEFPSENDDNDGSE